MHTKSRNEKALAHDLMAKDISYFLPMIWKTHRQKGRKFKALLPLFGGYMFFCGNENQRLEVLRTNRVANLIEVKDQEKLLNELVQIERAIEAGADLTPVKYVKAGQKCKVTAGPLAGLAGVVITVKGRTRLVLQVDMLGQAASVEVDADSIEIAD
jgi:transcription antitermination factor NusG